MNNILSSGTASLLFFSMTSCVSSTNAGPVCWTYQTEGIIHSTGVISDKTYFVGSDDNFLYALNSKNGKLKWKFNTNNCIRSNPVIAGDSVLIISGNILRSLNKDKGDINWLYIPKEVEDKALFTGPNDNWDYHSPSPHIYNDKIYYGDILGNIHRIDINSGLGEVIFSTGNSPVSTTIKIANETLFFADWDGVIHAVDLNSMVEKWSYRTYETKPYDSFGPIITQPTIYNGKLYIGARNYNFVALDIIDGSVAWTYNEPDGGWITGTPVINNGTLFIGGSDNKEMMAFNPESGDLKWTFSSSENIFCKPVFYNDLILFTDGDSYNHDYGLGHLYAISQNTGSLVSKFDVGRNIYTSPVISNGRIYIGSYDKKIYSLSIDRFI